MRRTSTVSPGQRQAKSTVPSSQSPITRQQPSQARRVSLAPDASAPSRGTGSISTSHTPQRRQSSLHSDAIIPRNDTLDSIRPRVDSIVEVPDHLERSSSPDSINSPIHTRAPTTRGPVFVSQAQSPPTQLIHEHSDLDRMNRRKISQTVDDLEAKVQEAVEMVDDTEDRGQVAEIYDIIEEAKQAIHNVSRNPSHLRATSSPFRVSSGDEDGETSESSLLSKSNKQGDFGQPHRFGRIFTQGKKPSLFDPQSQTKTPKESISYDWAYPRRASETHSNSSLRRKLLSTPPIAQASPRDHLDFVLRPQMRTASNGSSPRAQGRQDRAPSQQCRSTNSEQVDLLSDKPRRPTEIYETEDGLYEQDSRHTFSLHRHHRRQPIARNWSPVKKRLTAIIACMNTGLLGIIIGVYAGEVPRIQYYLADERHIVIVGNAVLYFGLSLSTLIVWPLPLLHGRKPYILAALALALPLQFPQAVVVSQKRSPNDPIFRTGLLCTRAVLGLVLGFANVNNVTVLLDLFGASLQSKNPHQEFVVTNDIRRNGGGMGIWLGIWSWCWIGSLAVGFQIGAVIIENLTPDWGFYIVIMILAAALILNIIVPETRRAPYRKSVTEVYDRDENYITRRVSRGEVKLHISTEGPKYWFEEVGAGLKLMTMMIYQPGFLILSLYLGWIYAQIVLVIVLLGALLSRDYRWKPRYVGAGVMSITIGAFLAIPLTKAGLFSRERKRGFRTDSMTFQKQITWSSHLVRRVLFTLTLPLMGLAYTISSAGKPKPYIVPIVFAGTVGFLSVLAIAECYGLIMETFDTCDLQPGVNTKHRLQSMAVQDRRRRTNYTSFPRVTAGIFVSQSMAFIGAGVATLVGGSMTRHLGAQASTGVTAGILLGLTIFLTGALWRFKDVQVIPNHTFGTRRDTAAWEDFKQLEKMGRGSDWKAVVIGNPSGKMRRMSALELGSLSRWTEIRKLNFLLKGPMLGEDKKCETYTPYGRGY